MASMTASAARRRLRTYLQASKSKALARFFKTGPGEYAEGDRFLGVMVPNTRKTAREFCDLAQSEVKKLLSSVWHEERLLGLIILTLQFAKGCEGERNRVFDLYVRSKAAINNWDLVDVTAPLIVGVWLKDKPRGILHRWAKSPRLWDRRLAMISTFTFIRDRDFQDALKLAEVFLNDREDLMHKATGWMLREIGNRDVAVLRRFLDCYGLKMPRTMLRYSIERLPNKLRKKYLLQKSLMPK